MPVRKPPKPSMLIMVLTRMSAKSSRVASSSGVGERSLYMPRFGRL